MRTHPCGVPTFVIMLAEVLLPILTDWGLPKVKKSRRSQRVGCRPSVDILWVSLWGMTVLKAEL